MYTKKGRYSLGLNIFILLGILSVGMLHASNILPSGNIFVSGIAYFLGAVGGIVMHSLLKRVLERFHTKLERKNKN